MAKIKKVKREKDLTRYAFKGEKEMLSKRQFAQHSIKELVKHFNHNAEMVSRMLDSTVLVEVDKIKPGYQDRYFTSPDELIVSVDRKLYAVTGEWTKDSIERLIQILKDTKFKVISAN